MYLNLLYFCSTIFWIILLCGCENNNIDIDINSDTVNIALDTLMPKPIAILINRDTIATPEKKDTTPDAPKINSFAPTIVESAKKTTLFKYDKWLKSDRSTYMKLHPGRISEYDKTIKKFARRYGFDWRLIAAQIYTESNFKNEAQSHVGAKGLMQVMPGTAKFMGFSPESMIKPEINIMAGCMYDQRMYNLWGRQTDDNEHRLAFALASYNAGRARVLKSYDSKTGKITWPEVHSSLPQETQNYVHKIFIKYQYYQKKALP